MRAPVSSASTPPRQVLLFTGHRVDAPDRATPRFPARLEAAASVRIGAALDALHAGPADLAFTQGASGGDLLFAEACIARGVPLQLLLPLAEADFIAQSIETSQDGARWRARFMAVKARLDRPMLEAPRVLGALPAGDASDGNDVFVRGNRWLLDRALAAGGRRLVVIALWDGGGADGPGGTRDLIDTARRRGAKLTWIDTRTLGDAAGPQPI